MFSPPPSITFNNDPDNIFLPQNKQARVLYNFEGHEEYRELTVQEGDLVDVLQENIAEGWCLAENQGVKGLVPVSYLEWLELDASNQVDEMGEEEDKTITIPPPPPPPRYQRRQLNRFTGFVTSGAEDFILAHPVTSAINNTTTTTNPSNNTSTINSNYEHAYLSSLESTRPEDLSFVTPSETYYSGSVVSNTNTMVIPEYDKHFIQNGPAWLPKAPEFQVRVHDPEKRVKMKGMQEFTIFNVTSQFSDKIQTQVERRFSQFAWLHERLVLKFPALIFPPLPEKQYSGRFNADFIEKRRRALERYINRVVRHPVARYSDLVTFFLSCQDEGEWKRREREFEADEWVGPKFFEHVYHPAFNVEDDEDAETMQRFQAHVKGMERYLPSFIESAQSYRQAVNETKTQYKKHALNLLRLITGSDEAHDQSVNEEGVWCWRDECEACLSLTKSMQYTSESMLRISQECDLSDRWIESAKEYASCSTAHAPLVDMHTGATRKFSEDSADDALRSRCETVFNVTLAEVNRFHDEKTRDFRTAMIQMLDDEISYHEKIISELKSTRALFEPNNYAQLAETARKPSYFVKDLADYPMVTAKGTGVVAGVVDSVGTVSTFLRSKTKVRGTMLDWTAWGTGGGGGGAGRKA